MLRSCVIFKPFFLRSFCQHINSYQHCIIFYGVACFAPIIRPVLAQPKPSQSHPTVHQTNLLSEFPRMILSIRKKKTCHSGYFQHQPVYIRSTDAKLRIVKLNITIMCQCVWHCLSSHRVIFPLHPKTIPWSSRENFDLPSKALPVL